MSYEKTSVKIYDHINVNYLSNYLITKRVINFMKKRAMEESYMPRALALNLADLTIPSFIRCLSL